MGMREKKTVVFMCDICGVKTKPCSWEGLDNDIPPGWQPGSRRGCLDIFNTAVKLACPECVASVAAVARKSMRDLSAAISAKGAGPEAGRLAVTLEFMLKALNDVALAEDAQGSKEENGG